LLPSLEISTGTLLPPNHGVRDDGCDVLHGDLLLAIPAVAVERLGKAREEPGTRFDPSREGAVP
jgi:hypothetical protein